ncbi:hypothetical protein [Caballeronia sp. GACF4]|uniref:hypothetical protein n=1 Tax=Caballeronia sp. GACF4 TaxID=2921763 RepID=UPI00202946BF
MQNAVTRDERLTVAQKRRLGVYAGAGFFLSPGAWLLQVIVSETVSAQTCDATTPLNSPGVAHLHVWLYTTSIVALAVAVLCAVLAIYGFVFLQKRHAPNEDRNHGGESREPPPPEKEEISRKRFIALCSTLVGCGFVVAVLFTILADVFIVSCSQWH